MRFGCISAEQASGVCREDRLTRAARRSAIVAEYRGVPDPAQLDLQLTRGLAALIISRLDVADLSNAVGIGLSNAGLAVAAIAVGKEAVAADAERRPCRCVCTSEGRIESRAHRSVLTRQLLARTDHLLHPAVGIPAVEAWPCICAWLRDRRRLCIVTQYRPRGSSGSRLRGWRGFFPGRRDLRRALYRLGR